MKNLVLISAFVCAVAVAALSGCTSCSSTPSPPTSGLNTAGNN